MSLRQAIAEADAPKGDFVDMVFKKDLPLIFPNDKKPTNFCILPAIFVDDDGNYDKSQYLAYRDHEDYFTEWLFMFMQHRSVGQSLSVLSPKVFDGPDAPDPVEELWDKAWTDERFWSCIGRDPKTKKIARDSYKTSILRRPEHRIVMNVIDPTDAEDPWGNKLLVVSRTSIFPHKYVQFPDRSPSDKKSTVNGLAEALDLVNRRVPEDVEQDDFDARFFEGDITDPRNLATCVIKLVDSPNGGIPSYNASVTEAPRIQITQKVLEGRFTPDEIFVDVGFREIVEAVFQALKDKPLGLELMYSAWSGKGIEYDTVMKDLDIRPERTTVAAPARSADLEGAPAPSRPASARRYADDEEDGDTPDPRPRRVADPEEDAPLPPKRKQPAPEELAPAASPAASREIHKDPPSASSPPVPGEVPSGPSARRRRIADQLGRSEEEGE